MPPAGCSQEAPPSELADVIAYLEQRRDNAATMAQRMPEFEPWAKDRQQQLDAVIGDLRAGLHVGSFDVRAKLTGTMEASDGAQG